MWMNQSEIEFAASRHHDCPNVRKGVRLLVKLVEAVNAQSDGWAYWQAPGKSAEKLMDLLRTAGNLTHGTHGKISDDDFRKAVAPIRRMVAVQSEKQKQYGNTFEFDVDAALASSEVSAEITRGT